MYKWPLMLFWPCSICMIVCYVNFIIIIIIIICEFIRRTVSASRLNLRCRQSLGGDDGSVK